MRVDWLLIKQVTLSVLFSLTFLLVQCDIKTSKASQEISSQPQAKNLKTKAAPSTSTTSSASVGISDPRNRYQLKFLTPYTAYPVRLKDHYGRKGNTRWFKYGSQLYYDEMKEEAKFYATDDEHVDNQKSTHLLLRSYDTKTNFLLDHYEPRHEDAMDKNSNQLYDYDYTFETNIDREIYTLLYLMSFELDISQGNSTIDNINQVYANVTCHVTLMLPSALSNEHSAILNERLENSLHMRLKLFEPNTDESNAPADSKEKRRIRFNKVSQVPPFSASTTAASSEMLTTPRLRLKRSSNASSIPHAQLYQIEIMEGPIRVFRDNFNDGLNASCSLSLRDFDKTYAFNSFISNVVFASTSSSNVKSSSVSVSTLPINFCTLLVSSLFFVLFSTNRF